MVVLLIVGNILDGPPKYYRRGLLFYYSASSSSFRSYALPLLQPPARPRSSKEGMEVSRVSQKARVEGVSA